MSVADRVSHLNATYRHHAAIPILTHALNDPQIGRVALVSSFGAESVVLLHMISVIDSDQPVLFIDTEMMFPETLAYQQQVSNQLGLTNVQIIKSTQIDLHRFDPNSELHKSDAPSCCYIRKVKPLQKSLSEFDAWITGRKRFQSNNRASLNIFENEDDLRIKINPLAHWTLEDLQDYIINNDLPKHPLVEQGFASIGCAPLQCTQKVTTGNDPRNGRWMGQEKTECGIHTSTKEEQ